jgi:hypothetical protein
MTTISFARHLFPPAIIRHTVWLTFALPSATATWKICSPSEVWMRSNVGEIQKQSPDPSAAVRELVKALH